MRRVTGLTAAALLAATLTSGCQSPAPAGDTLVVFAAASLKQSLTEIGEQFKTDNPGATVEFSFAGSSDLVTQLTQGARADVLASADTRNMDRAAQAGLLDGDPVNFASNTLTIAVAPGNPERITSFRDLTREGLTVVVCAPQVPCGTATERIEQSTGVQLDPVSEETSVSDVLNKISSGQADAGLVYVTDVAGSEGKVAAVDVPEAAGAVNTYPIAALDDAANPELARRFVDYVTGEAGQRILGQAGFGRP
jgi:molybdate transport system substrate-binding protein